MPIATTSGGRAENDRDRRRRTLGGIKSAGVRQDNIDFQINQFSREAGEPIFVSLRVAKFDVDVLAFDIVKIAKSRPEGIVIDLRLRRRPEGEVPNTGRPVLLLPERCERPRDGRASSKCDKLPPSHFPPQGFKTGQGPYQTSTWQEMGSDFSERCRALADVGSGSWPCQNALVGRCQNRPSWGSFSGLWLCSHGSH
jgi:hypothetical protein